MIAAVLLAVGYVVVTAVRVVHHAETRTPAAREFFENRAWLPSRALVWAIAALVAIAVLTPSSQTLYLIAGSEIGEQVVMSEDARAIYDDVRAVLRSYAQGSE